MTVTVGARSLDNEERSNFRDYVSGGDEWWNW